MQPPHWRTRNILYPWSKIANNRYWNKSILSIVEPISSIFKTLSVLQLQWIIIWWNNNIFSLELSTKMRNNLSQRFENSRFGDWYCHYQDPLDDKSSILTNAKNWWDAFFFKTLFGSQRPLDSGLVRWVNLRTCMNRYIAIVQLLYGPFSY